MAALPSSSLAVLAGSLVQVAVAAVAAPTGGDGDDVREYDTVITPPGYAFAVWGPIFAADLATGAVAAARPEAPVVRAAAWPLAGACALNAAWLIAVRAGRFGWTPA